MEVMRPVIDLEGLCRALMNPGCTYIDAITPILYLVRSVSIMLSKALDIPPS